MKKTYLSAFKKTVVIISLLIFLLSTVSFTAYSKQEIKTISDYNYVPPEGSNEELYRDLFVTLLLPHIQQAINDYYGKYLKYLPGIDPWGIDFLSIERTNAYIFVVKLEVAPYIGSHNTVGLDRITLRISDSIKVEDFEHVKDFPLPPNYQDYYKNNKKD